jgi:hypothetical protein
MCYPSVTPQAGWERAAERREGHGKGDVTWGRCEGPVWLLGLDCWVFHPQRNGNVLRILPLKDLAAT